MVWPFDRKKSRNVCRTSRLVIKNFSGTQVCWGGAISHGVRAAPVCHPHGGLRIGEECASTPEKFYCSRRRFTREFIQAEPGFTSSPTTIGIHPARAIDQRSENARPRPVRK